MDTFTVSFFGHRKLEEALRIESRAEELIRSFLIEKPYVVFLVGRDGEFDQLISSVIRRCKREVRSDNSAHVWVLPYATAELRTNEESFRAYYDEIEICAASMDAHYKNAHQIRNREMVDRSDFAVFYIQYDHGGAWQTMNYVQKQAIPYINLNNPMEDRP